MAPVQVNEFKSRGSGRNTTAQATEPGSKPGSNQLITFLSLRNVLQI